MPPSPERSRLAPIVLFGAFDRHNLGDLLFPHLLARLLPGRALLPVGLAARDLRRCGGHRVHALAAVLGEWQGRQGGAAVRLIHAGGEVLAVDAWQSAVMLLPGREVAAVLRHHGGTAQQREQWAAQFLGTSRQAPYVVPQSALPPGSRCVFNGVGGVDLDQLGAAPRGEAIAAVAASAFAGVRDARTAGRLAHAGVACRLMPDCGERVAELLGDEIRAAGRGGAPAAVAAAFPRGYLAVQFAAELGDDASLERIAGQLRPMAGGRGIVFFRAGAAPWHDDRAVYRRCGRRLGPLPWHVFASLSVRDICALVAAADAFVGTSLHAGLVAEAFGRPAYALEGFEPAKLRAYRATWRDGRTRQEVLEIHREEFDRLVAALDA